MSGIFGLGEVGSDLRAFLDVAVTWLAVSQDNVGAGDVLDVEPVVVLVGLFQGQPVVLQVVLAD